MPDIRIEIPCDICARRSACPDEKSMRNIAYDIENNLDPNDLKGDLKNHSSSIVLCCDDKPIFSEREHKMMAFMAGILLALSQGDSIDSNEQQQLRNIASELGYFDLSDHEFRY